MTMTEHSPLGYPGDMNRDFDPNAYQAHSAGSMFSFMEDKLRELEMLKRRVNELGIDAVTGLPTRVILDETYSRMISPHPSDRHHDTPPASTDEHSVLFLDVDDFGAVNKARGDSTGDMALRRVADAMRGKLRHNDQPGRYGGEEFAAILFRTPLNEARVVAERVRNAVETEAPFEKVPHLTVSVGVGTLATASSFREAVVPASQAMRVAKSWGKNQVVVFDEIPSHFGKDVRSTQQ